MAKTFIPMLLPLRGTPIMPPIMAYDTETFGQYNQFQIGVVSTREGDFLFEDAKQLLDFICRKEYWNHAVYATNLQFDGFAPFQAIAGPGRMPDGWSFFDNGSKFIWVKKIVAQEVRKSTGAKKFRYQTLMDSLNLFPGGVAKMGEILLKVSAQFEREGNQELASYYNESKLVAPKWLGKRKWSELNEQDRNLLSTYCAADARVTRKFMEWFGGEITKLGGEVKMTAASTCLDIFRRKYMNEDNIVIPQPSFDCLVESRLSYYGGRTEDFVKGTTEDVWEADVTSMYPDAMVRTEYPYPSPERFTKWKNPPASCLQYEGFSNVTIKIPYMEIPPLPFRQGPKLLFPYGTLKGVWTNLEIRYALTQGCGVEEIEWSYFNQYTFNPFKNYVLDLFAKRMEYSKAKMATEEVVKLFLNGLYGKFGQNFLTEEQANQIGVMIKKGGGTFKSVADATLEEIMFTGENYPDYLAKGYVINKAVPKLQAFMNPILSSYTTAAARVKLHDYIVRANKEHPKNTLYVDTDSLYTKKKLSFTVQEKILGTLQQGKNYKEMLIVGPKAKRLITQDNKMIHTAKGVPEKSFITNFKTLASKDIEPRKNLFASLDHPNPEKRFKVRYSKFMKFKEAIAQGLVPNEIRPMSKQFDPFEFPKRRIVGNPSLPDLLRRSYDTEPWEVDAKTQLIIGEENA